MEYKLGIKIDVLKEAVPVAASAGGRDFAVMKVGDALHVLDGKCSHKGGPLAEGHIENGELICPWHKGAFNINTGKASKKTGWVTNINIYKTRVDTADGEIYVEF